MLCFVFNYSRIFLSLIGYCDFSECLFFGYTKFPIQVTSTCILLFFLTILLIDIGYKYTKVISITRIPLESNPTTSNILMIVMFICFPLAIYGNLKTLIYVRNFGYAYFLTNSNKTLNAGIASTLAEYIFKLCFYTSFMCKLTKKKNIVRFSLYFLILIFSGIKGSRSSFLFPFVFFMIYMINAKIIKVNTKFLILFPLAGILFFFLSSSTRGIKYEGATIIKILEMIAYGQSDSVALPLHFINSYYDLKHLERLPFIFGDLVSDYIGYELGQSIINNFQIDYARYSAVGLGCSPFVEIWDLGIFGIAISIFIGFFIKNVNNLLDKNKYINTFIIISGMSIMWLPRDCILRNLFKTNVLFVFAAFMFFIFLQFVRKSIGIKGGGTTV